MQTVGCTDECREKKKQKNISDLLVDAARDVDGCGCGWTWMWMQCGCRCGCGVDVDADMV